MKKKISVVVPVERIEKSIVFIRGEKVMLDEDLAELYGVPTKALIQAVKRNLERFPADFLFQLSFQELVNLRSQIVTSSLQPAETINFSGIDDGCDRAEIPNFITQKLPLKQWGGRRTRPYAFTEQGVAMLSSVLNSQRAISVNVEIMRAFVKLRQIISSNAELSKKLSALEAKYDGQFKVVFEAIRELMKPLEPKKKRRIGF